MKSLYRHSLCSDDDLGKIGCPKKIRDLIFPYFCSKSENLCIKTHPDQILGYSEHKSSLIIEVEVLLVQEVLL